MIFSDEDDVGGGVEDREEVVRTREGAGKLLVLKNRKLCFNKCILGLMSMEAVPFFLTHLYLEVNRRVKHYNKCCKIKIKYPFQKGKW